MTMKRHGPGSVHTCARRAQGGRGRRCRSLGQRAPLGAGDAAPSLSCDRAPKRRAEINAASCPSLQRVTRTPRSRWSASWRLREASELRRGCLGRASGRPSSPCDGGRTPGLLPPAVCPRTQCWRRRARQRGLLPEGWQGPGSPAQGPPGHGEAWRPPVPWVAGWGAGPGLFCSCQLVFPRGHLPASSQAERLA